MTELTKDLLELRLMKTAYVLYLVLILQQSTSRICYIIGKQNKRKKHSCLEIVVPGLVDSWPEKSRWRRETG